MKKLTTTLYIILCFYIFSGILGIVRFISDLYNLIGQYISESNSDLSEIIYSIIKLAFVIYLTYHFYTFSNTVNKFDEKSFFHKENGVSFKRIGKAIIVFVVINLISGLVFTLINGKNVGFANWPEELLANIVLLMMALFLLIISHLILSGYQLKKENDLTI